MLYRAPSVKVGTVPSPAAEAMPIDRFDGRGNHRDVLLRASAKNVANAFEAAARYRYSVDVVRSFPFVSIYWWGGL